MDVFLPFLLADLPELADFEDSNQLRIEHVPSYSTLGDPTLGVHDPNYLSRKMQNVGSLPDDSDDDNDEGDCDDEV